MGAQVVLLPVLTAGGLGRKVAVIFSRGLFYAAGCQVCAGWVSAGNLRTDLLRDALFFLGRGQFFAARKQWNIIAAAYIFLFAACN